VFVSGVCGGVARAHGRVTPAPASAEIASWKSALARNRRERGDKAATPVVESAIVVTMQASAGIDEEAAVREWIARGELSLAAQHLVREHGRCVLSACVAIVRDRSAAEDLAQEVFSAAFTALPSFRGESKVRTWLLGIARHRCIDHLRAARREPFADDAGEPAEQADEAPLAAELVSDRRRLEAALAELAEGDRALVVLRYKNGLEYAELASAFGLREGTVRMRLSRALARMRAVLEAAERGAVLSEAAMGALAPAPEAPRGRAAAGSAGFGGAPGAPPPPPAAAPMRARASPAPFVRPADRPVGALGLALASVDDATRLVERLSTLARATFG
jgi:RNA polymerase sigma-70 factor (ECF subfamily)